MCASKFVVYILLVSQLIRVESSPVSGSAQIWNGSANDKFDPLTGNYHILNQRRTVENVLGIINGMPKVTVPIEIPEIEGAVADIQNTFMQKEHYFPSNIIRNSSNDRDDDDDDEFHFLVTGGYRPARNNLVKYVVSLRTRKPQKFFGDNHFCGGSIISKKAILTAAHCLFMGRNKIRASRLIVVAGTPRRLLRTGNTQEVRVSKVKPHPKYARKSAKNDVGIVLLKNKLTVGDGFADIIPIADKKPKRGLRCTVVGWGTVIQLGPMPDDAINGDVTVNSQDYCSALGKWQKGQICASNKRDYEVDSCQGDSGGPLFCNKQVVGIVSFGEGCGMPHSAGFYTDVYHFRKWIKKNAATCPLTCCPQLLIILAMIFLRIDHF